MRARIIKAVAIGVFVAMATTVGLAFIPPSADAGQGKGHAPDREPVVLLDQEEVTVEMSVAGFDPAVIEIETGTTVTWHNTELADYPVVSGYHSVVADDGSFDSKKVAPGARWSFTFDKPGTYDYHCSIHPHMTGRVVVTGEPVKEEPKKERVEIVEPDPNDQQTWGYKPESLDIEVGTTVTWVNNGAQDHTVTDDDGDFDSGTLKPGEKFTFTFKKAGVYNYKCEPHPWMKATVRVSEPGKAPPKEEEEDEPGGGSGSAPPPPAAKKSGGGDGPTTHFVNIIEGGSTDEWGYDPSGLSIATGDTVMWENTGSTDHTVTASDGSFDSGSIPPGGTWEYTFEDEGEFEYMCTPHPFMVASISVSDSPSATGATSGKSGSKSVSGTDDMSDMAMSETASGAPDPVAAEESGELTPASFSTLSGKEASLGLVAGTLAAAIAFLLGQWWGYRIKSTQRLGAAN